MNAAPDVMLSEERQTQKDRGHTTSHVESKPAEVSHASREEEGEGAIGRWVMGPKFWSCRKTSSEDLLCGSGTS